jgi:hypothetical protein
MTDLMNILADDIVVAYPAQLDALHERCGPGNLTASTTGYSLASPARLPGATDSPLRRFGLAFTTARSAAGPGAAAEGPGQFSAAAEGPGQFSAAAEGPGQFNTAEQFACGLLALHRDLLRRALQHTLYHLEGRTSGGTTLLSRQLVQGQLADIAMALSAENAMPQDRREGDLLARWRSHQRMVAAGRELVRLLGASGFLIDGPAADLYLAEVAGNVYLHPGECDD